MKLNDIKFLPKTNAFGDVYAKATGVPFIGEMMAAAAGNGGEPTPPTPSVVESVTVYGTQDGDFWEIDGTVTFSQDFMTENCDPTYNSSTVFTLTIKDSNNTTICESESIILEENCENNVWEAPSYGEGTLPTLPESGNYSIVVSTAEGLQDPVVVYEGTGTWTYQDQQI